MDVSTDSLVLPSSRRRKIKLGEDEITNNRQDCEHGAMPNIRQASSAIYLDSKKYVSPPDGGWGWVVVVGVWIDNMLVIGMLKSLGVLFPEFRNYFMGSAGAISWINSISLSMRATGAPIAAALSNRFGERPVVAVGGIMVTIGMIISRFAQTPYYLYISLGIISGMGFALASLPALTMIGRYFDKRRSLANGLSRSGGAATFFLAPLLQFLVSSYGWQGALTIVGALELNLLVCAMLFRPLRLRNELELDSKKTLDVHRKSRMLDPSELPVVAQKPGGLQSFYRRENKERESVHAMQKEIEHRVEDNGVTESLLFDHFPQIQPVYEKKESKILKFSLLKNPLWVTLTLNLVLTQFGYAITLVHTVARAKTMGIGDYEAVFLLSFIGIMEVTAQLSSGWFADKNLIRRIHLHKIYIAIMALATFISLFAKSYIAMVLYCVLFGIGSGSWQGNILPVTVDTLGVKDLRSAYGFCLFFSGVVGQMLGPPVAGALFDSTGDYHSSFICATCCFVLASMVLFFEIPARKRVEKRKRLKNRRRSSFITPEEKNTLFNELRQFD